MRLYIGNKCYSSWSLRPWIAMSVLGIDFEEELIPFDDKFSERISEVSAAGMVPVLVDGDIMVWESLAILEYLADRFSEIDVWPRHPAARAHARAISAEMHAGFTGLRSACPMNLGKRFQRRDRGADVAKDVSRIVSLWQAALEQFGYPAGGPFLYGPFSAADAMYAPVVTRLDTYDIEVPQPLLAYMKAVLDHPAMQGWLEAALKEDLIFDEDEVDEPALVNLRSHLQS